MRVYVHTGTGAYRADAVVAWTFHLPHWGMAGQGRDEHAALSALEVAAGEPMDSFTVVERVHGDERFFVRDREPASPEEFAFTRRLLDDARAETIRLVAAAGDAELDWSDPARRLPSWARWHTARQLAWHIADTESRYYLPSLGVAAKPRAAGLLDELRQSHTHVQAALVALEPDLVAVNGEQEWSTVKLLRRLAWHEPGELIVLRRLLTRARWALQTQ